jgi:hypothetical protein
MFIGKMVALMMKECLWNHYGFCWAFWDGCLIFSLFYLARASVRANDQVKALQEINKKQDAQIDLLIQIAHNNKQV